MKALPIDPHLIAITDLVKKNSVVILSSTPGSGKTTRLPPELLASTVGKILVLEPRRIAASMAAQRIADERNWSLGKDVGFQVRFENRTSSTTRLVFLTEALLLKKMISDPTLSEVGLVIFD